MKLTRKDLLPGDLLLSMGSTWHSWLIRWLDRGSYSHAAMYNGAQIVEISLQGVVARPPDYGYACDVYRYVDDDGKSMQELGPAPVINQLSTLVRDERIKYGFTQLILAALLIVAENRFRYLPNYQRIALHMAAVLVVRELKRVIDEMAKKGTVGMTCSQVPSTVLWNACTDHQQGKPYGLRIKAVLRAGAEPLSAKDIALQNELREILLPVLPELANPLPGTEQLASIADPVAGTKFAPLFLVSPGDVQRSPNVVKLGRWDGKS